MLLMRNTVYLDLIDVAIPCNTEDLKAIDLFNQDLHDNVSNTRRIQVSFSLKIKKLYQTRRISYA